MIKLSFPKDELKHSAVIEWWYFNGNLLDEAGHPYVFMYCLFKADPTKVQLPFLEKIPLREFYFSHFLISDVADKKSYSGGKFFFDGLDQKSFSEKFLLAKEKDLLIEENPIFQYRLKTVDLDLNLVSEKMPLLVGGDGLIDLKTKKTYYYSLTDLKTRGKITFNNKSIPVSGKSWLDHQWADSAFSPEDKWTWLSLQLDNGTDILCFNYGDKLKTSLASVIYPDNSQKNETDVVFRPSGIKWISPKSGAAYNLDWEVEIPGQKIFLKISPKILEQEVLFGNINYWEGGIEVAGTAGKNKISGKGFLEIVGAPMKKSLAKIYLKKAKDLISGYFYRP